MILLMQEKDPFRESRALHWSLKYLAQGLLGSSSDKYRDEQEITIFGTSALGNGYVSDALKCEMRMTTEGSPLTNSSCF